MDGSFIFDKLYEMKYYKMNDYGEMLLHDKKRMETT